MRQGRWCRTGVVILLGSLLAACSTQAPYMRDWDSVAGKTHRWTGGTVKADRLSEDEAAVYRQLGAPDVIRYFRALHTRQQVYEWIYDEQDQVIWFVAGKRVDYVAVDTNTSRQTKETREMLRSKLTTGGLLGTVVGGFAAGFLLLGDSFGLKN